MTPLQAEQWIQHWTEHALNVHPEGQPKTCTLRCALCNKVFQEDGKDMRLYAPIHLNAISRYGTGRIGFSGGVALAAFKTHLTENSNPTKSRKSQCPYLLTGRIYREPQRALQLQLQPYAVPLIVSQQETSSSTPDGISSASRVARSTIPTSKMKTQSSMRKAQEPTSVNPTTEQDVTMTDVGFGANSLAASQPTRTSAAASSSSSSVVAADAPVNPVIVVASMSLPPLKFTAAMSMARLDAMCRIAFHAQPPYALEGAQRRFYCQLDASNGGGYYLCCTPVDFMILVKDKQLQAHSLRGVSLLLDPIVGNAKAFEPDIILQCLSNLTNFCTELCFLSLSSRWHSILSSAGSIQTLLLAVNAPITDQHANAVCALIEALPNLQELHLEGNALGGSALALVTRTATASCPHLHTLGLAGNAGCLTDEGLESVAYALRCRYGSESDVVPASACAFIPTISEQEQQQHLSRAEKVVQQMPSNEERKSVSRKRVAPSSLVVDGRDSKNESDEYDPQELVQPSRKKHKTTRQERRLPKSAPDIHSLSFGGGRKPARGDGNVRFSDEAISRFKIALQLRTDNFDSLMHLDLSYLPAAVTKQLWPALMDLITVSTMQGALDTLRLRNMGIGSDDDDKEKAAAEDSQTIGILVEALNRSTYGLELLDLSGNGIGLAGGLKLLSLVASCGVASISACILTGNPFCSDDAFGTELIQRVQQASYAWAPHLRHPRHIVLDQGKFGGAIESELASALARAPNRLYIERNVKTAEMPLTSVRELLCGDAWTPKPSLVPPDENCAEREPDQYILNEAPTIPDLQGRSTMVLRKSRAHNPK